MGRGGLSQDPATRKRQLAALKRGREVAKKRRSEGLPTKRREALGDGGGSSSRTGVKKGRYAGQSPAKPPAKTRQSPASGPAKRPRQSPAKPPAEKPKLNAAERVYAKLLGLA